MARRYPDPRTDGDKYLARERLARTLGIIAIAVASVVTVGLVYIAFAAIP